MAWKNTDKAAIPKQPIKVGSAYHVKYWPQSIAVKPFNSCTSAPAATLTRMSAASATVSASTFGVTKVQSGAGVESTISCIRFSRSRHTSSPA